MKRNEVKIEDQWRLDEVYRSIDDLKEDSQKVLEITKSLNNLKGKLSDIESLKEYLRLDEKAGRLIGKVFTYAHNRSNEDLGNQEYQGLLQEVKVVYSKFIEATSFFEPEILSLKEKELKEIIDNEELKEYKFMFESLLDTKPHVLSQDKEEILASLSNVRRGAQVSYSIFTNSELKFPDILDSNGEKQPLTQGLYFKYIKSKDRVLRKNSFETMHETYGSFENTLGSLLSSSMNDWNTEARLRGYESPLHKALGPNNIPVSVFENALKTLHDNLPLIHRYVDIKKKALKLDEIHLYDLYTDITQYKEKEYTFEDGVKTALEGLKYMGSEYLDIFKKGIESGWIDKYENEGKRSGAYSSGSYDTAPYILLNYKNKFGDLSTMTHEMGHSIHSYYTRKYQPYHYGQYSIFLAEVASTCNQKLLIHHLIETTDDKDEKIALILEELEQIRTTVVRQLMFAEFEKITHNMLWEGKPLTAKEYDKIFLELNRKYFGEDIIIDELVKHEWARIPHFYNDFYVYQYATGYAAASSFARMIKEDEKARDKYIEKFLKAGASKYPVDVLKEAGVDMTSSKPMQDTIDTFKELLDLVEKELNL